MKKGCQKEKILCISKIQQKYLLSDHNRNTFIKCEIYFCKNLVITGS